MRILAIFLSLLLAFPAYAARDFNGTTDRIDYTNVINPDGDPFTFAAWVNFDTGAGVQYLLGLHNSGTANSSMLIVGWNPEGNGQLHLQINAATQALTRRTVASTTQVGSWAHYVLHGDGSATATNYHWYVNGSEATYNGLANQDRIGTETAHNSTWSLGGKTSADSQNLNGKMAAVGFWNRELSTEEISMLADGYAPTCIQNGLVFAPDLLNDQRDTVSGRTGTLDGTSVYEHPRIIQCTD